MNVRFYNYTPDVVPEDAIRNAIRADGEEWALDWIGGTGLGWWQVMWNCDGQKWPRPERSAMFLKKLNERGLVAVPMSSAECVFAIHRIDRATKE